jgi:CobQ/CobB/MinD/ParA family nucleotide binding protein
MRVAFMGKGGAGKSTLAGTLCRALARQGVPVLALDVDTMPGLAFALGGPAHEARLPAGLASRQDGQGWQVKRGLRPSRLVDRFAAELPEQQYDLLLDAFFLDRALFRRMQPALRPEGLVVVHTLMRRRQHEDRNPAHLLEPGELATSFPGLRILHQAEDDVAGWAELVARRDL